MTESKKWEEEFDKKFPKDTELFEFTKEDLKSFIHSLINEIIEEFESLAEDGTEDVVYKANELKDKYL